MISSSITYILSAQIKIAPVHNHIQQVQSVTLPVALAATPCSLTDRNLLPQSPRSMTTAEGSSETSRHNTRLRAVTRFISNTVEMSDLTLWNYCCTDLDWRTSGQWMCADLLAHFETMRSSVVFISASIRITDGILLSLLPKSH